MDNTRDELLDLIRNATNIDMICFFAIIYVVAPDSPPYTPIATRGELKKAIRITAVQNFEFTVNKKKVLTTFTVVSIFGEINAELGVEI